MDEKKIFAGLGILVALLLVVAVAMSQGDGPDIKDLIAEEVAPISEAVEALGTRIDGVEGSLGDITEQLAAATTAEDLQAVSDQVSDAMAQTSALSESVGAMQSKLDETTAAVAAAATAATPHAETEAPVAEETSTATTDAETSDGAPGLKPGQTALFADGGLRLFVSRLDTEAEAVRVSVMGDMKSLAAGQARTFAVGNDYCRVTVEGVSANGAVMDALCGDDLPEAEGISAGETQLFADGALRIFASRVTEDEARLSLNGDSQTLALGETVSATAGEEKCEVSLDALDRGHAMLSADC